MTINTPTDDCGNVWQLCTGTSCTDSTNHVKGAMYYVSNAIQGTRHVTVSFSNYLNVTTGQTYANVILGQWCNVGAYDKGSGGYNASGTTMTSGAGFTSTNNGELILCTAFVTASSFPDSSTGMWTASTGYTFLSADIIDNFSQGASSYLVQTTAGATNPGYTIGTAHSSLCMACSFASATAGTPRPAGIQIVRIQGQSQTFPSTGDTVPFQFPCSGNLLVAALSWLNFTSMTDTTNGGTWTLAQSGLNGGTYTAGIAYKGNATPSPNLQGSLTSSSTVQFATVYFYDVAGAATSPLGAIGTNTTGGSELPSPFLTTSSITPTQANSLVIATTSQNAGSAMGCCGDPRIYNWDYPTVPQDADLYQGPLAENNSAAHAYTQNTNPLTFVYSGDAIFQGNWGNWAGGVCEFLAATPTRTQYPVAPVPQSPVILIGPIGDYCNLCWRAPANCTNVTWTLYGGGGASGYRTSTGGTAGGGGGGCITGTPVVSSTAQNLYCFQIGPGDNNVAGTTWSSKVSGIGILTYPNSTVGSDDSGKLPVANSGTSVATNGTTGGAGGSFTTATGFATGHNGGTGGASSTSTGGGGGGGGAGPTGVGGTGGAGGASLGGTAGAAGTGGLAGAGGVGAVETANGVGNPGNAYGGGGGGSHYTSTSESGGVGGVAQS